jgi:hypothetical protein
MCARLLMVQLIGREQRVSAHRRRPGDFLSKCRRMTSRGTSADVNFV